MLFWWQIRSEDIWIYRQAYALLSYAFGNQTDLPQWMGIRHRKIVVVLVACKPF